MELKKKLYRYAEAAELLAVSSGTIARLADDGLLNRVFVGSANIPRITARSVEVYIRALEYQARWGKWSTRLRSWLRLR